MTELARICQELQSHQFKIAHVPVALAKQRPIEHLLYIAGQDAAGKNMLLKIYYLEDFISCKKSAQSEPEDEAQWGATLAFQVILSTQVYSEQITDLNHLAGVVNRSCPLGCFVCTSQDGLYYEYKLIGPDKVFSSGLLKYVLEHISMIIEQFMPLFQTYLNKEQSLSEILKELGAPECIF